MRKKAIAHWTVALALGALLFESTAPAEAAVKKQSQKKNIVPLSTISEKKTTTVPQSLAAKRASAWTLEQCVTKALATHPDLAVYMSRIQAESAAIEQIAAGKRPQIDFNSSYTRTGTTHSDPDTGKWSNGISAEQLISDWGRRDTSMKSSASTRDALTEDYQDEINVIAAAVRTAYYAVNRDERDISVYQQQVKTMKTA